MGANRHGGRRCRMWCTRKPPCDGRNRCGKCASPKAAQGVPCGGTLPGGRQAGTGNGAATGAVGSAQRGSHEAEVCSRQRVIASAPAASAAPATEIRGGHDTDVETFLALVRAWEAGRPAIDIAITVDAPQLTTADIVAILRGLDPRLPHLDVQPWAEDADDAP